MYHAFFHLRDNPFAARPDPRFLWLGPKQAEALAALRREIFAGKGFVLLTGDAGAGKTTLADALTAGFAKDVAWAVVGNPGPTRLDFYRALARGFGIDREFSSKVQFLLQFSAFLQSAREAGQKVVLLVDDCHRLSQDLLEELRLLANIARDGIGLIDVCFIGRREFLDILAQPSNQPVSQRLTGRVELEPLSPGETEQYIRHRLKVAGSEAEIFTAGAIQRICRAAAGNPGRINMICDQALKEGAAAESRAIDGTTVERCLAQLSLVSAPRPAQGGRAAALGRLRRLLHGLAELLPAGRRGRWLRYGLGGMLIGGVVLGLSLFLPWKNDGDTGTDAGRPAVQQPVARKKVRSDQSPGVGKLEPIGKAIDLDLPAGRAGLVARQKDEAKQAGEQRAGEAATEPEQVAADTPASPSGPAAGDEPGGGKATEPSAEQAKAGPEGAARLPPMQRSRVVLPLRANSLELTEEATKEYGKFIAELKEYPQAKLLVKGFVSATTNSPANVRLSEERAAAVRKLLIQSGIDAGRITVKGMGNRQPLAGNDTQEGRVKNRRVEIEVVDDGR